MSDFQKVAEDHVDWFLGIIRPLLISWMVHGHKHGKEEALEKKGGE